MVGVHSAQNVNAVFPTAPEGSTYRSDNAADFPQHPLHAADRAENQGADNHVHRLVLHLPHVLSGHHHEVAISQMRVRGHAPPQVPVKVRVVVGADHRAAVGVELEVCPAATTDLQQAERAVGVCESTHVSEKLPLRVVHFVVV